MFPQCVFVTVSVCLGYVYSLPLEEKIEPVELFHRCVDPVNGGNDLNKSPVLLLHALLISHKSYEGVNQLIADRTRRRVCSVDLRNHGESPWNNRTDIAAFAVDVGHFLDTQNIEKVNLIGESLGGKIALHYALNNPHRVDSLIVEDIRPNKIRSFAFSLFKVFIQLLKNVVDSQPNDMNENEAKVWALEQGKMLVEQIETYQEMPSDFEKYLDLRLVNGKWQLKANLEMLYKSLDKPKDIWTESTGVYTGPTLFLYGTESIFKVGDDKDEILKLFPNAKLIPFEGAGHLIHELHREYDDIVVEFLNGIK